MRSFQVVVQKPFVEISLQAFQILVKFFAEGDRIELILHGPMQALTDPIGLGMPHLGLTGVDVF